MIRCMNCEKPLPLEVREDLESEFIVHHHPSEEFSGARISDHYCTFECLFEKHGVKHEAATDGGAVVSRQPECVYCGAPGRYIDDEEYEEPICSICLDIDADTLGPENFRTDGGHPPDEEDFRHGKPGNDERDVR